MNRLDRNWRSRFLRTIVTLRNSPEAIARGAAVGVCIAFLPVFGFQMIAAAILATALKANRPAAILATWVSNPLTMPPLFLFTYRLGSAFVGQPTSSLISQRLLDLLQNLTGPSRDVREFLNGVANLGSHIVLSLVAGGLIAGLAAAALCYPASLWLGRRFRTYRERRRSRFSRQRNTPPK